MTPPRNVGPPPMMPSAARNAHVGGLPVVTGRRSRTLPSRCGARNRHEDQGERRRPGDRGLADGEALGEVVEAEPDGGPEAMSWTDTPSARRSRIWPVSQTSDNSPKAIDSAKAVRLTTKSLSGPHRSWLPRAPLRPARLPGRGCPRSGTDDAGGRGRQQCLRRVERLLSLPTGNPRKIVSPAKSDRERSARTSRIHLGRVRWAGGNVGPHAPLCQASLSLLR